MFLETPVFPACPNFGAQSQPRYNVTITQTVSGRERRNRNWKRSLAVFDIVIGPREEDTIQEILEWWHAMGGIECGFRYTDYSDFKSCRVNQAVANTDQPMLLVPGSPPTYQLIKTYTVGARQQVRPILKPQPGTVVIAKNGVTQGTGTYTLDTTTGVMTPGFAISDGDVISAGFMFDVPVRFASEFPVQIVEKELQSVTFTLQETRDPNPDTDEDE